MTVWATRADQVDLRGPNPHDLARSPAQPAAQPARRAVRDQERRGISRMGSPRDPGRVGDRQAPQDPPCAAARFFREGAQPPSRRAPASTGRRGVATGRRGIGCQVRRRRGQPAAGSAGRPDRRGRPASHLSPATVTGEIQLIAAHITSWLDCSGATLTNEGVRALTGDRLTVDGDLFLTRARRAAHLGRPVPIPIEFGPASTPAELSPSMQLCAGLHGIIDGIPSSSGTPPIMTEPTGRLQRRVEGPVTDPLELATDAPAHRRGGRLRRGDLGGEQHAARLPPQRPDLGHKRACNDQVAQRAGVDVRPDRGWRAHPGQHADRGHVQRQVDHRTHRERVHEERGGHVGDRHPGRFVGTLELRRGVGDSPIATVVVGM